MVLTLGSLGGEIAFLKTFFAKSSFSAGVIGQAFFNFIASFSGKVGGAIFCFAGILLGVHILFAIPWVLTIRKTVEVLKNDFSSWMQARAEFKTQIAKAKEQAKQNGGFDKESLRKQLADKLGVDPSDISIEAPDMYTVRRIEPDGSRGVIHYKVLVPMDNISAGDRYFGLKNERRYAYVIESSAPSEYLGGQP